MKLDPKELLDGIMSGKTADDMLGSHDDYVDPNASVAGVESDPNVISAYEDEEENPYEANAEEALKELNTETGSEEDKSDENQLSLSKQDTEDSLPEADGPEATSSIETVTVTDDKGRRQIEVDLTNKDQILDYVKKAHGMRKFQAERDNLAKQLESFGDTEVAKEKLDLFEKLDSAYQNDGVEGMVKQLTGNEADFKSFKEQIIEEYKVRQSASPNELARMDAIKEKEQVQRELSRIKQRQQEVDQKMMSDKEQAELNVLQTKVDNAFNKYRFDGKLNDPSQESILDETLFSAVTARFEKLRNDNVDLTDEVIENTIRDVAMPIRKYMNSNAKVQLKKSIQKQKESATANVQASVKSKMSTSNVAEGVENAVKGNRTTEALLGMWVNATKRNR